jgi:hypothetical protein
MAKASFLGVVSFGRFVPDWGSGSVTMLTVMVNLPYKSRLRLSVLNEMHTNSYTGPRLIVGEGGGGGGCLRNMVCEFFIEINYSISIGFHNFGILQYT